MFKREQLVVNNKTFTIEHAVEQHRSRVSALEFTMQYARAKTPSLYKDEEETITNVFFGHRLLGTIRKAPNGMFCCRTIAHRDINKVIQILVNGVL
jgi:hypothetical protein